MTGGASTAHFVVVMNNKSRGSRDERFGANSRLIGELAG